MQYPGHIVKRGEQNADIVKAVKARLNSLLVLTQGSDAWLDPDDASFGQHMRDAVKLFQARNLDRAGRPLKQDGEIGSLTWESLFGETSVDKRLDTDDPLLAELIRVASEEADAKIVEDPKNSNRGTRVDEYMKRAGAPVGHPWCCAFVYFCFDKTAANLGRDCPMVKTAGCLHHWNQAPTRQATRITAKQALSNPALLRPGMIFIIDYTLGLGHTGILTSVTGGLLNTIEGNTNGDKSRDGGGVYRMLRKVSEINKGYIDYAGL